MRSIAFLAALVLAKIAAGQAFAPTGSQTFEVASIKPAPVGTEGGGMHPEPGGRRYVGSNLTLRDYLYVAYQVKPEQIAGGPSWADSDRFEMNAEAAKPSSIEDLHIMVQNLMTERFKLQFHFETKEMSAYMLTLDKGGPKNLTLRPGANGGDLKLDRAIEGLVHAKWSAHCSSMDFMTWALSPYFERPLVNQTGLTGCFEFNLAFTLDLPRGIEAGQAVNGVTVDTYGPTIYQALQNQLGLKLEARKGPVQTLVIDHAERPTTD